MIDVFLNYHEECGYYFAPREAIHEQGWRSRENLMVQGSEHFEEILKRFKPGRPSFETIKIDGKSHLVNYATC